MALDPGGVVAGRNYQRQDQNPLHGGEIFNDNVNKSPGLRTGLPLGLDEEYAGVQPANRVVIVRCLQTFEYAVYVTKNSSVLERLQ